MLKRALAFKTLRANGVDHVNAISVVDALIGVNNDKCETKTVWDLYDYITDWVRFPALDQHGKLLEY